MRASLVLAVFIAASTPAFGAPWSTFKHDNQRTGRSTTDGPQTSSIQWATQIKNYGLQAQLAVGSDGSIYSGSVNGDFYAFDPNGKVRWKRHLGPQEITAGASLAKDGAVYIASEDGILHAFTSRGHEKWTFDLGGYAGPSSSPLIDRDGAIYIGTTKFYALNENGSLRWSYDTGGAIAGPAAMGRDGTLYFPSTDYLYAIGGDGTLKWRAKGHGSYPLGGAPSIAKDGTIYINTYDGAPQAYTSNGKFKWKFTTPGVVMDVPSSPAIGKDGTIYFGGRAEHEGAGGYFYALNPDGSLKWQYFAGCDQTAPAIGGDGTIYFGSDACGTIHALNSDGSEKWFYDNDLVYVRAAPVIAADGTLYAGLMGGYFTPNDGGLVAIGP